MNHLEAFRPLVRNVPAPVLLSDGSVIDSRNLRRVTEDDVVTLLGRDDFVSVAVLILYARQCEDERAGGFTKYDNKVGFNAFDADRGTFYGEWVTGKTVRFPNRTVSFFLSGKRVFMLNGKHLQNARTMLHKYRKQIAGAINAM